MIRLEIMSQMKAVLASKTVSEKTAIISITAPGQRLPEFAPNPNIIGIFRMRFWDVSSPAAGLRLPKQSDFDGLRDFTDEMVQKQAAVFMIHCAAGISRSAATAAAISDYLHLNAHIFDSPSYFPNRLVYKLARHELGLSPGQDWEVIQELEHKKSRSDDPRKIVKKMFKYTKKGLSAEQAARRCHISTELAEKVMDLCITYQDAGIDEILIRMGIGI